MNIIWISCKACSSVGNSYVCYTCAKSLVGNALLYPNYIQSAKKLITLKHLYFPNILQSDGSCAGYQSLESWLADSFRTQTIFLLNAYHFHKIRLKMLSWIIIIQAPTILRKAILLSSDIAESRKAKLRGRLLSKKNLPEGRQLEGSRAKNSRRGLTGITAKATFTVLRA